MSVCIVCVIRLLFLTSTRRRNAKPNINLVIQLSLLRSPTVWTSEIS